MKLFNTVLVGLCVCAVSTLFHCRTPPPDEPEVVIVPPLDATDEGGTETPVEATTTCGRACARLRSLGCSEGKTTPSGSRCYDVCRNSTGMLDVDCVVNAASVEELRSRCHVRCAL
jgi:hypothetical protein